MRLKKKAKVVNIPEVVIEESSSIEREFSRSNENLVNEKVRL